jgi:hypothetical protein
MPIDPQLEAALTQFRLDVIRALAEIDVEIDALQQAMDEGKTITPERRQQIRKECRARVLGRFIDYHAQHIAPADVPSREP